MYRQRFINALVAGCVAAGLSGWFGMVSIPTVIRIQLVLLAVAAFSFNWSLEHVGGGGCGRACRAVAWPQSNTSGSHRVSST